MIELAICDHDENAQTVIMGAAETVLRDRGFRAQIERYSSGEALLEAAGSRHFDLVLLEVELPGMDGIQTARRLQETSRSTRVIFISERESRVFDAMRVQPLGFVRKSRFFKDLTEFLNIYMDSCLEESRRGLMELATRSNLVTLDSRQVQYVEGCRNYQQIYISGGHQPVEVKMTMDKLEKLSEPYGFIRIHKGYLVNSRHIRSVAYDHVILLDGTRLPVGRSKAGEVKRKYLDAMDE